MQMHVGSTGLPEYMFSLRGQWCIEIGTGEKNVEVRKRAPKAPFRGYIYCTKSLVDGFYVGNSKHGIGLLTPGQEDMWPEDAIVWNGKVIGEFICNKVTEYTVARYQYENKIITPIYDVSGDDMHSMRLTGEELAAYGKGKPLYGIHLTDVKIYDKPLSLLQDFRKPCIMPEQPYCPCCEVGGEYITDDEAEAYRMDGCCNTEWVCCNWLKKAPQSWCRVKNYNRREK